MNTGMNEVRQVYVITKDITESRNGFIIQQINSLSTLSGTKPGDTMKKRPPLLLSEGARKEFTSKGDCVAVSIRDEWTRV